MNELSRAEITLLLNDYSNGNKDSLNRLLPVVYKELRKLASRYLRKEYSSRTIQTTELVHEAYMRLFGDSEVSIHNRAHFFGIAANSMRQILVDYARKKSAAKRGGGFTRVSLIEDIIIIDNDSDKIIIIDEALKKLALIDNRLCSIVELRFFTGLSIEETAEVMGISVSTVKREWNIAKAWLYRELEDNKNI
jgi:RNA polymerase sigma factor (TIGR02999 family)